MLSTDTYLIQSIPSYYYVTKNTICHRREKERAVKLNGVREEHNYEKHYKKESQDHQKIEN